MSLSQPIHDLRLPCKPLPLLGKKDRVVERHVQEIIDMAYYFLFWHMHLRVLVSVGDHSRA